VVPDHVPDAKVLEGDEAVLPDKPRRELVVEVQTLALDAREAMSWDPKRTRVPRPVKEDEIKEIWRRSRMASIRAS
jgi:hypothetical protein